MKPFLFVDDCFFFIGWRLADIHLVPGQSVCWENILTHPHIYNTTSHHLALQDDLQKLENWETIWDMEFHSIKMYPSHVPCKCKKHSVHVNNTATKGNPTCGFIKRNILTTSKTWRWQALSTGLYGVSICLSSMGLCFRYSCKSAWECATERVICGIRGTDWNSSTTKKVHLKSHILLQPLTPWAVFHTSFKHIPLPAIIFLENSQGREWFAWQQLTSPAPQRLTQKLFNNPKLLLT